MNTNLFSLRSAEFEDAGPIFELVKSYPMELLPRPIHDIVENIDRFVVCIADNNVIGTVSWQILPEIGTPKQPSIELKSLAVTSSHRQEGVGTALVKEAIERIKSLHPSQIIVLTFTPVFFQKLGFKEIKKESIMHRIYMGCVNCSKYDSPFTCPETAMALVLP